MPGLAEAHRAAAHPAPEGTGRRAANWGFPGDLGHVSEELAYVLASLGDLSAVDAKGLDC